MRVNTFRFFGKALFASLFVATIFGVANAAAYTVTYNANGALFNNGEETNVVIYNDDHGVVSGEYKLPEMNNPAVYELFWSTDEVGKKPVEIDTISSDITVYAQYSNVVWNYGFTGGEQTFTLPYSKYVRYELWGAEGGKTSDTLVGGYGGYSMGFARFNLNTTLYINNGGAGGVAPGHAYNGGGSPYETHGVYAGAGGGATHIALESGVLADFKENRDAVLMVAGGAGGSTANNSGLSCGGSGGGFKGGDGEGILNGVGGSQTTGGVHGGGGIGAFYEGRTSDFGLGGNAENGNANNWLGGAGGAGWFGGSGGGYAGSAKRNGSGGGGSGYIANSNIIDGAMYGYHVPTNNEASTLTYTVEDYSDTATSKFAKQGDGHTRASIIRPTITYKWDDNEESMTITYREKASIDDIDLSRTAKPGYNFVWQLNGIDYDFDTPVTEDIELVAKYTLANYNLTYDLGTGTLTEANPATYTIESEDITLNNPTAPDYYTFLGWSGTDLDGDENLTVTIPKGSIGDREYTANIKPTKYNISYELNGGSSSTGYPATYDYETPEITLANPVKEGHTFLGWSGTDLDGNENFDVIIPAQSHGDREYTANWSINQYTATFDVNGGSAIDSNIITSDYGVAFGPLPETHIDGYKFLGWFTEQDGGEEISASTTMPAEDHIYYAHWELITYTITYVMDGHINSDTNPTSFNVHSRDIVIADAEPKAYYYYFLGWTTNPDTEEDLTKDFTIPSGSTEDITLYAIFQQNPYTIEFDCENYCEFEPITKVGEEPIGELPTPEREGYIFLGWFIDDNKLEPTSTPRSSATAIARWEKIEVPNTGDDIIKATIVFIASSLLLGYMIAKKK